jgi:endonuclease/exonuclease/phosphatase family metal-dependent hydrolase
VTRAFSPLPNPSLGCELTVATQNAWGGVFGWPLRRSALARWIDAERPHVIGLQEVHVPASDGARGQAHELADLVGGYDVIFAPGRLGPSGMREGVALLCRCDVREHAACSLTLDRSDRWDGDSQRVVLHATVELPVGSVDVFVTHLSLSERARARTVAEIQAFVGRQRARSRSVGAVLLGDFNAMPAEASITTLEAPASGPPWLDAWKRRRGPPSRGGTWPAFWPRRRIDYVFVQPDEAWEVRACERLPFLGSDHLGVLAHLRIQPDGSRVSAEPAEAVAVEPA